MFTRNKFHPKTGLIPYIELNGEQFSDSNIIIEMLCKKFEVEMDTELSPEEEAMTRAATGMVESFTAQTGFYYRYGLHMEVGDKNYSSSSVSSTLLCLTGLLFFHIQFSIPSLVDHSS